MIELNRHIEILLLDNDCVIVPDFGGFMAHHVDACYIEEEHLFLPPRRTLGFNPQLKLNDHLLVQSYIEAYDISYPEASKRIEDEVRELKMHIETEGEYEMTDIGILRLNEEGRYEFTPCEAGILTPSLYGFSSFEMPTISELTSSKTATETEADEKVSLIPAEEKATVSETVEQVEMPQAKDEEIQEDEKNEAVIIKMSWIRNAVAVAAAILVFFMLGIPVSNSVVDDTIQQSSMLPAGIHLDTAVQQNNNLVSASENETNAPNKADQSTEQKGNDVAKSTPSVAYTIVLASQTPLHHAETFVESLSKKGYTDTHIMQMKNCCKVRVVYSSFASEEEAQNGLRQLRSGNNLFTDAWVLKVEK